MKKKYVGLIILLCCLGLLFFYKERKYYRIKQEHTKIIQKMIDNPNNKNKEVIHFGYIEIPKLKVKRVISSKYNQKLLDKDFACIFYNTNYLEDEVGNSILVGHNNKGLFLNLNNLKVDDRVYIYINQQKYQYKVVRKEKVRYNQYHYSYEKKKHILTLITCTKDKEKRLAVTLIEVK